MIISVIFTRGVNWNPVNSLCPSSSIGSELPGYDADTAVKFTKIRRHFENSNYYFCKTLLRKTLENDPVRVLVWQYQWTRMARRVRWKSFDDTISHFNTIHDCDRQTDWLTDSRLQCACVTAAAPAVVCVK